MRSKGWRAGCLLLAGALLPLAGGSALPTEGLRAEEPGKDPPAAKKVNSVFTARTEGRNERFAETGSSGFGKETEAVIDAGLDWLVRHQDSEGAWTAKGVRERCIGKACPDPGTLPNDVGITSLSLLAFLGTGASPASSGPRGDAIRRGLAWLLKNQDSRGCLADDRFPHFVYSHAIATMAVIEGAAISGDAAMREAATRAVSFLQDCRNPGAGWRYGIRPRDTDTSTSVWCTMALLEARFAGIGIDETAVREPLRWFDGVTDSDGRVGYTALGNGPARPMELMEAFPVESSEAMTAAACAARLFAGVPVTQPGLAAGLRRIGAVRPRWTPGTGHIDFYYWYFGSLATFQAGGADWKAWQADVSSALMGRQGSGKDDCARGSFDAMDPWGPEAGRVYSTVMPVLMLETPYRFRRLIDEPADETTIAVDSRPRGARVLLDDRELGVTPLSPVRVPPGSFVLRLEHPACADLEVPVAVTPLDGLILPEQVLPPGRPVDPAPLPNGCTAWHEGRRLDPGGTVRPGPARVLLVQPRRWTVVLEDDGAGDVLHLGPGTAAPCGEWTRAVARGLPAPMGPVATTLRLPAGATLQAERIWWEKDGAEMGVVPATPPDASRPGSGTPAFLLDRHEVTVDQWKRFCRETKRASPKFPSGTRGSHPVTGVDYRGAVAYAAWAGKRIPREAEWLAAAGPRDHPWGEFDGSEARALPPESEGQDRPPTVGSFPGGMGPWGHLDLEGGVMEWVLRSSGALQTESALRGGSWKDRTMSVSDPTGSTRADAGFRCAADLPK